MRNPLMFVVDVMGQALWIRVWVVFMMFVNLASILFWEYDVARLILYVFLLSATFLLTLYAWFGYKRILGLGHILWIPLLYCLAMELPSLTGGFKAYIALLMVTNGISLVFDITDVWRYMRGDR